MHVSIQKRVKSDSLAGRPPGIGPDGLNDLVQELAKEFNAPLGLLDAGSPTWTMRMGVGAEAFPDAEEVWSSARDSGLIEHGWVQLWRPQTGPDGGPIWLMLPVPLPEGRTLVAIVGFAPQDGPGDRTGWGPPCPDRALRAWGQATVDRLRAGLAETGDRPDTERRPEHAIRGVIDRLSRRLRVSDAPGRFQRLAVAAMRQAMGVEAVAWVPVQPREPVVVVGGVEGLRAEDYRRLVPDRNDESALVINQPPGPRAGSKGRHIAVITAEGDDCPGWFVAVNPVDGRPFVRAEVERFRPVASLVGTQRANAHVYADLKDLLFGVVRALTSAIDAKDPYTSGHSERVARIAVRLGEELGLSPAQCGDLYLMGLLHDVGKIGVEDSVLKKSGPLTPEEFRRIQSHVRIGVHILSDLKKLGHLLPGVAHHHENMDGTGYPSGLAGDAIPLEARILAVADSFDAMSSTRPYRRRLAPTQIDEVLERGAGKQWDPRVVSAVFACRAELEAIRQKGLGESLNRVLDNTLGRA